MPALDDVFNDDDIGPGDILDQVRGDPRLAAFGAHVAAQAEAIDVGRELDGAGEVRKEAERTAEDADEHQPLALAVVGGDARAEFADAEGDVLGRNEVAQGRAFLRAGRTAMR